MMKKKRSAGLLVAAAATSVLAGCKLAVIVGEGGQVQSLSGTSDCPSTSYCVIDIDAGDFSESFTAVANPGYEFIKWQDGEGFLCANSTDATCTVEIPMGLTPDQQQALLDLFLTGRIMPLFADVGLDRDNDGIRDELDEDNDNDGILDRDDACPLDPSNTCAGIAVADTFTAPDGRLWAQPDLFQGLNWNDVNAVCPDGICAGTLEGYDMEGWVWASVDDANDLVNQFNGAVLLGPGPDSAEVGPTPSAAWEIAMQDAGVRSTFEINIGWIIETLLRDEVSTTTVYSLFLRGGYENVGSTTDFAATNFVKGKTDTRGTYLDMGVLFYRVL